MSKEDRIILVGNPGVGKAILGKKIAEELSWDYINADYSIEIKTGIPITQILGEAGNKNLRNCEYKILEQYKDQQKIVLNTDAGIILSDRNRELIKNNFLTIFVTASINIQLERLSMNTSPLFADSNLKDLLHRMQEREKYFREVASLEINTDDSAIEEHVIKIANDAKLNKFLIKDGSIKIDKLNSVHLHRITHKPIKLSSQQSVILKLLAHGKSAKEIGRDLDISHRTVEGHLSNMKEILGCSSSADLISLYLGHI